MQRRWSLRALCAAECEQQTYAYLATGPFHTTMLTSHGGETTRQQPEYRRSICLPPPIAATAGPAPAHSHPTPFQFEWSSNINCDTLDLSPTTHLGHPPYNTNREVQAQEAASKCWQWCKSLCCSSQNGTLSKLCFHRMSVYLPRAHTHRSMGRKKVSLATSRPRVPARAKEDNLLGLPWWGRTAVTVAGRLVSQRAFREYLLFP